MIVVNKWQFLVTIQTTLINCSYDSQRYNFDCSIPDLKRPEVIAKKDCTNTGKVK